VVQLAVLDVNETLFTLDAVGAAFDAIGLHDDDVPRWFAALLRDGMAAAAMGGFAAFPDLVAHHVGLLAHQRHVALPDDAVDRVVRSFDAVEAQPDVPPGLRALADVGVRLLPFTNGSAAVVARFLARSGLNDLVEAPLDVTGPGVWKPAPDAYRWVCRQAGVALPDAVMVAVHPWDVAGAMAAGMHGAWVDRDRAPWPAFLPPPDVRVTSLEDLPDALPA